MTMNLKSWGLLTLTLVLPSCLLDFDGYRERPADGGNGAAGNAGGNGGAANGASGGDGGSAAGGSGNAGGSGGNTAAGSGGDAGAGAGGSGDAGSGGNGNAAGSSGAAGDGGSSAASGAAGNGASGGCAPEDPEPVCGPGMNCQFRSIIPPYDYSTHCVAEGTGVGLKSCSGGDTNMCAAAHYCISGTDCYRWCRLGSDDCAVCGGGTCQDQLRPVPSIGSTQYGLCSRWEC